MNNIPIVEITLHNLSQQLTTAYAFHRDSVEKEVEAAVKQAVEKFDFRTVVIHQTNIAIIQAVEKAVKNYFNYGEGEEMINDIVGRILEGEKEQRNAR